MRRALSYAAPGDWPAETAADGVTLDFDARHRRRIRLTTDDGAHLLLDLPKAVAMAEGGGLRCDDGGWLAVHAAAEPLLDISCPDPRALARIAWHLGNRHLPAEIRDDGIRIRPDHVIEDMLRGLGAAVRPVDAPFQPEGGAYAGGGGGHGHHHDDHEHDHGHDDGHDHHHHHGHGHAHRH